MRILIAEDDENSRLVLKRFIEKVAQCDVAVDGGDAIEKYDQALAAKTPYHLIFLDIMMPRFTGLEVLSHIRAHELERGILGSSAVQIVMTTALDDEERIFDAHVSGCVNYLIKPLARQLVLEEIEKCREALQTSL
jgi:two-component system, chemotaxis family, chemotaxis protein CheY